MTYERWNPQMAKGCWPGILREIGMPAEYLRDKHGPCPFCPGGTDRYRFDDKDGDGTSICSVCGARAGMQMVQDYLGVDFITAKDRVMELLGRGVEKTPVKPGITEEDARRIRQQVWQAGEPIRPGDLADTYFRHRGLAGLTYPKALRLAEAMKNGERGVSPTILAAVMDLEGICVAVHRTYLRPDGRGKADLDSPRKITPGGLPDGMAVRLGPVAERMGVAEGIETAFAASRMFGMPVWSCLNAAMLVKWKPPEECQEVTVFGDNDASFTGQAAAYALARKITLRDKKKATVCIPSKVDTDWLDEMNREGVAA